MRRLRLARLGLAALLAGLLAAPPMLNTTPALAADAKVEAQKNVLKGKILGVSRKAKTITIEVKGKPVMVKFTDETQGIEHAQKGEAAIITFSEKDGDRVATVIKPKLVQLPEGVAEIKADELAALVALGPKAGNYFLVDSRPAARYHEGHIPTAVSIPVPKLKKTGSAYLPGDAKIKDIQLIFYCGGPT